MAIRIPHDEDEEWTQLATRIPQKLQRAMKLHCVETEQTVMAFVEAALREKLRRARRTA